MTIEKNFVATFKTAKSGVNAGKKRENLVVPYVALETADIAELNHNALVAVLNDCIVNYGKRLLTENSSDWEYVPTGLDFGSFYEDFSAPSARGNRILSKEKLTSLAATYELYAVETLKKSEAAAATGAKVIMGKFSAVSGNDAALTAMAGNLSEMTVSDDLVSAYDALLEILSELMSNQIVAEAL